MVWAESTFKIHRLGLGLEGLGAYNSHLSSHCIYSRCLAEHTSGTPFPRLWLELTLFFIWARRSWMGCLFLQQSCPYQPEDETNVQNGWLSIAENLGAHWRCWDIDTRDSEPPSLDVLLLGQIHLFLKWMWVRISCYLFWKNTLPFHGCLSVRSFGLVTPGPWCQRQLPDDRCSRIFYHIIAILQFYFPICPSLESLTP